MNPSTGALEEDPAAAPRRQRLMVFDGVGLAFGAFGLMSGPFLPILRVSAGIR